MKLVKQVLGVDVAQKELVATLGRMNDDFSIELYAYCVFKNNETGIAALLKWVKKLTDQNVRVHYVMEATGVYHQKFAYYLDELGFDVSIVLPNKISNYMRTLENKTTTDKSCSEAITRFGLERKLDNWVRPAKVYKQLQQLTREREQIVTERVVVKNQLHAEEAEAEPNESSVRRLNERIKFLNRQEMEIKREIHLIVSRNKELKKEIENICTIPGVGELTAVIILAETNGFELIRNKRQLVSYAGLDVREKLSGTSVKGKPRISKKGNRYLRAALHLPALGSIRSNENYRDIYAKLVSKSGIKMKGLVAIQRKLLELIYIIHKNKTVFMKDYEEKKREQLQLVNSL
ncbi:MAG: IS110 family transposase [Ignavibacteria bacterium GWF2_33_9]|nr:MAG: IS110 family transposase [Ignavibacteria bacterium GWF2_33_9]